MVQTINSKPHFKFWPPGLPYELEIEDKTLWDSLHNMAVSDPDETAMEFIGVTYTWKEFEDECLQLAGALQELGVKPGDRVALFAQNCPQFAIGLHAAIRCGAVVVPINPMNKAVEVAFCVSHSGAKVALASADIAGEFKRANEQLNDEDKLEHLVVFKTSKTLTENPEAVPEDWRKWLCSDYEYPSLPGGKVYDWQDLVAKKQLPTDVNMKTNDLALLMFTSGTTGQPKACMHTHRSIIANASVPKHWHDLRKNDAVLVATPMFHITGLVGGLLGAIDAGAKSVILPRWQRRVAAEAIEKEGVTHWTNIPTMVIDLLAEPDLSKFDLCSLRYIGGGGASMPEAIASRLKSEFDLDYIEAYGLTETAAPSHANPRNAPRFQCLGIPNLNVDSCILDTETMTEAPVGELGEIIIRGPQVFSGYWNNEEATKEAFVELNGHTWFRSGDLGRCDEDGYFYIADRLKRMVNASGFKVWPAELEGHLFKHPAIQDVCVIAKKDDYRGQSVKAIVVLKPDHQETTDKDIMLWARENMAVYKVPREVEFVEALPKGASGKVLWKVLQDKQDAEDNKTAS